MYFYALKSSRTEYSIQTVVMPCPVVDAYSEIILIVMITRCWYNDVNAFVTYIYVSAEGQSVQYIIDTTFAPG